MLADKHATKRGHTRPDFMASDGAAVHEPPAEAFGHSGTAAGEMVDKALEAEASGNPLVGTHREEQASCFEPSETARRDERP